MSLNRIAASTSYRRSGCSVISVTSSGRVHDSSIGMPSRTSRYSGSERPAWRMNQTGVYGTGSLRQARMKGEFVWGWVTMGSYPDGPGQGLEGDRQHPACAVPRGPAGLVLTRPGKHRGGPGISSPENTDTPPEIPRMSGHACQDLAVDE